MKIIELKEERRPGVFCVRRVTADVHGGLAEVSVFEFTEKSALEAGEKVSFGVHMTEFHIDQDGENCSWYVFDHEAHRIDIGEPPISRLYVGNIPSLDAALEVATEWVERVECMWPQLRTRADDIQKLFASERQGRGIPAAANVAPLPWYVTGEGWGAMKPALPVPPPPEPILPAATARAALPAAPPPTTQGRAALFARAAEELLQEYAKTKDKRLLKLACRVEEAAALAAKIPASSAPAKSVLEAADVGATPPAPPPLPIVEDDPSDTSFAERALALHEGLLEESDGEEEGVFLDGIQIFG